ncbi:MAG: beta-glucuronidase [Clostridia bacterium]|nr:beta-glucuronidase [Clostridia bacterium]
MGRTYQKHKLRKSISLDGAWKFMTDPEKIGENSGYTAALPSAQTVFVPGLWNHEPGLLEYEGAAWYEKDFYTDGGTLRFHFGAVMTDASIYLDGDLIGGHYGGFCEFDIIAPEVSEGEHRLTVRADNTIDSRSVPQRLVDWYNYGGIARSVNTETLNGICVLSDRFEYTLSDDLTSARAYLCLELYNAKNVDVSSRIEIMLESETVAVLDVTLGGGETRAVITDEFVIENVRLWDIGSPELYMLYIKTETDDLAERVGFRKICVENGQILLNNKPIEIRGVNRHDDHPDWGFAFPEKLMKRDVDLIKDLNCNAVRAHYPNSHTFLDLLDENGIMFWSEIPIWGNGFSEETLADPVILERTLEMHREMVKYYYNHPAITVWGLHNEILSASDAAYNMSKLFYTYLKENGGNRIVTFASSRPMIDRCFEFCDMICINMYYGWYDGDKNSWNKFLEEFRERRDRLGMSHKPVIFSEFGCAALYGHHTFDNIKWTEEYQSELLEYCLKLFHSDPMVHGFYIWQFCDMRTSPELGLNRARGFNNKGILNEYRKPKAAYRTVKETYKKFMQEQL